jgi:hypothetical protein
MIIGDKSGELFGASEVLRPGETKGLIRGKLSEGSPIMASVLFETETPDIDNTAVARLVGLISWGVGTTSYSAEVDLLVGIPVTLVASNIDVSVRYEPQSTILGVESLDGPPIRVKAGIGPWARPSYGSSNSARRTFYLRIPAGQNQIVKVPKFAISMLFNMRASEAGATVGIGFQSNNKTLDLYSFTTTGTDHDIDSRAMPILNGVRHVQISNSGLTEINVALTFNLAL